MSIVAGLGPTSWAFAEHDRPGSEPEEMMVLVFGAVEPKPLYLVSDSTTGFGFWAQARDTFVGDTYHRLKHHVRQESSAS